MKAKDGDKYQDCSDRSHGDVRVLLVEVVLKLELRPEDLDNGAEEEHVDDDGDDGRDRQEEHAVPVVHPAVLVLVHLEVGEIEEVEEIEEAHQREG